MAADGLNLFALVTDKEKPVRRIPLSGGLQSEITAFLAAQKKSFYTKEHKVDFSGSYNADEGEVFRIKDFPLDEKISTAIQNPLGLEILDLRHEKSSIVALFTGKWSSGSNFVGFQAFDSRRILSKGFTILNSGDVFTRLEDPGLTLADKLTALFEGNEFLFYSYHNTRHFVDLSKYYKEATDTDLEKFASDKSLRVADRAEFIKNADSLVRKKIALLQRNKVLRKVTVPEIITAAKEFDLDIETENGNKIVIPADTRQLKNILRFLDEDYFTTVLTRRKCLTNSKEYL